MQSSGVSHEAKRHAHQEAVARLVISGATLNAVLIVEKRDAWF